MEGQYCNVWIRGTGLIRQDRESWRAHVNAALNPRIPQAVGRSQGVSIALYRLLTFWLRYKFSFLEIYSMTYFMSFRASSFSPALIPITGHVFHHFLFWSQCVSYPIPLPFYFNFHSSSFVIFLLSSSMIRCVIREGSCGPIGQCFALVRCSLKWWLHGFLTIGHLPRINYSLAF